VLSDCLCARRPAALLRGAECPSRCRRPSTRPVLKHGPRSLTCAQVTGFYETYGRSESKSRLGRPRWDPWHTAAAHHRPVAASAYARRSKSVHVGTRKMVNYA
jgi:hypothetical protein